jgi:GNAT superfamily N-acetyltransferase
MTIRALEPERDAPRVVELLLTTNPTAVTNTDEWLHRRRTIPERAQLFSRVADDDDRIVGLVEAGLNFFGSGDVASLAVRVDPEHRTRGIGGELYALGLEHVRDLGAKEATTMFDESEAGVAFATVRGWHEVRAEMLAGVDPRAVTDEPDPSIELVPAAELDPRELHRIDEQATRDMPAFEAVTDIDYDEWLGFVWNNPLFTREGSFGAVVDGEVAAVSLLLVNTDVGRGVNMFTGTAREHRGRGLAYAVKLATTRWAAAHGVTQVVTTNDETNAPMIAVNRRLGYLPLGRRVEYALALTT